MPFVLKNRRNQLLSLAQLTYGPPTGEEISISEQLKEARRVARIVTKETQPFHLGCDFTDLANIRISSDKITLLVKNAAQQNRLRQLLPRINTALGQAGFLISAVIRIRPTRDHIDFNRPIAQGSVRTISETSINTIKQRADSMEESALKQALLALAQTTQHK